MKLIIVVLSFVSLIFIYDTFIDENINNCELSKKDSIYFANKSLEVILDKFFDNNNREYNLSKEKIFLYKKNPINLYLKNEKCDLIFLDKKVNDSLFVFDINELSCRNDTVKILYYTFSDSKMPNGFFDIKFEKNKNELTEYVRGEY